MTEESKPCPKCPPDSGKLFGHRGKHIGMKMAEESEPSVCYGKPCPKCPPDSGKLFGHRGKHITEHTAKKRHTSSSGNDELSHHSIGELIGELRERVEGGTSVLGPSSLKRISSILTYSRESSTAVSDSDTDDIIDEIERRVKGQDLSETEVRGLLAIIRYFEY